MNFKRTLRIALTFILAILIVLLFEAFISFPKEWNRIEIGMTRTEMKTLIGKSLTDDISEHKGDVFIKGFLSGRYRMDVFINEDNEINSITTRIYLGTKEDYFSWTLSSDKVD